VLAALERTFDIISPLRSDLWNSLYYAAGGKCFTDANAADIVWNLQTWPLELIDWPVQNSHRRDVWIDPNSQIPGADLSSVRRKRIQNIFHFFSSFTSRTCLHLALYYYEKRIAASC
jgi:hypothetical protein